jgi:hypothetical protein
LLNKGKHQKEREDVDLSNHESLDGMPESPMTNFMTNDCQELWKFNLFQEGVIENNSLALESHKRESRVRRKCERTDNLEEAIEVSVGVSGSSRTINHVDLG